MLSFMVIRRSLAEAGIARSSAHTALPSLASNCRRVPRLSVRRRLRSDNPFPAILLLKLYLCLYSA